MNEITGSKLKTWKLTELLSYGSFFTGLFFILLSVIGEEVWHWQQWVTAFVRDFGLLLSAVMAGGILHEKLLRDDMITLAKDEFAILLENKLTVDQIAGATHKLFSEHPPGMTGLRLLNETRRNYPGYYEWVNRTTPQDLFFSGRSVLHRIDADIRARHSSASVEAAMLRRLQEGAKIEVLFLDPRIDIIDRLALEEGQEPADMLADIAVSIGICKRLFELIDKAPEALAPASVLAIRIYDRIPYFAFHKQDDHIIVGFYFSNVGSTSAAYEVVDIITKQIFNQHFQNIFSEFTDNVLVTFTGAHGRPRFSERLFNELKTFLCDKLGEERINDLINGSGHQRDTHGERPASDSRP